MDTNSSPSPAQIPNLTPADRLVLAQMMTLASDGPVAASAVTIADATGLSDRTVKRSVTRLENLGLLVVERTVKVGKRGAGKLPNTYSVDLSPLTQNGR